MKSKKKNNGSDPDAIDPAVNKKTNNNDFTASPEKKQKQKQAVDTIDPAASGSDAEHEWPDDSSAKGGGFFDRLSTQSKQLSNKKKNKKNNNGRTSDDESVPENDFATILAEHKQKIAEMKSDKERKASAANKAPRRRSKRATRADHTKHTATTTAPVAPIDPALVEEEVVDAAAVDPEMAATPKKLTQMQKEIQPHNNHRLGKNMATPVKDGEKRSRKPVVRLTIGDAVSSTQEPVSPMGMNDDPIKPTVAKRLRMEDETTMKPAAVSINSRTAKRVNGVPVFGTFVNIYKDERGVTMYHIKFDDGSTESVTQSVVRSHRIPVYNQFRKSDNGRPVETDNIPIEPSGLNLFGSSKRKASATKAGQKNQYTQQTASTTTPKRGRGRPKKTADEAKTPSSTGRRPKLHTMDGTSIITHGMYDGGYRPYPYLVKKDGVPEYKPIFTIREEDKFIPQFHVGFAEEFDLDEEPIPDPSMFSSLMLPDHFIDEIVHRSNMYVRWRTQQPRFVTNNDGLSVFQRNGLRKKNSNFLEQEIANNTPEITRAGKKMFMYFFHSCSVL